MDEVTDVVVLDAEGVVAIVVVREEFDTDVVVTIVVETFEDCVVNWGKSFSISSNLDSLF